MNGRRPIGILTLHYGYNEGALLQAYCLCRALRRVSGGRPVEIIDQRYPGKVGRYGEVTDARRKALRHAIENWLPLSHEHFTERSHALAHRYAREHCAALVVGSDQVWCLKYRVRLGGLYRSQPYEFYPSFPNAYWPEQTIGVPRIAYAASVGDLKWEDIPRHDRRHMERILSGFALLSVREQRTLDFLNWISPQLAARTALVPDPTFAHDALAEVDRTTVKRKLVAAGVDFGRPRIGLISKPSEEVERALRTLRAEGAQVVGITTPNSMSDVRLWEHELHPLEWAAVFGLMDYCIVERMHACIYCLQNHTPFVAIDINEPGRARNRDTKLRHLTRLFEIEDYCIRRSEVTAARLLEACREMWKPTQLDSTLRRLRGQADAFLSRVGQCVDGAPGAP